MAEGKSFWAYVGMGCLVLGLLAVLGSIGGGFWLFQKTKRFEAEMKDPDARTERARKVLGIDEIPEGYHAMVSLSVPFGVMKMAILSSQPPDEDGEIHEFGERGLIYVEMITVGQDEAELRDYFEGKTSDPGVLRDNRISIDTDEIIRRGVLPLGRASLMYVAQRGSVATHGMKGDGITSIVLVDCPEDRRLRTAIWFAPDPAPGEPVESLDLTGTPADEAAITEFFADFAFCD